jgi:hypothetical protein
MIIGCGNHVPTAATGYAFLAGWRHRLAHLKRLRNPRELRSMWEAKTQEEKVRCRLPPSPLAHSGRPCLK